MTCARSTPDYDIEPTNDGLLLRARSGGTVHYLNRTAGLIYAFCDGRTEPHEIASKLAQVFATGRTYCDEVNETLRELRGLGLIEYHPKITS